MYPDLKPGEVKKTVGGRRSTIPKNTKIYKEAE
jgi:hypothetical protein